MNFDILVNRKNTDCIKWDGLKEIYGKDDILPLWIADMDFESSPEIIDALINRSEHGVFGYPLISAKIFEPFIEWNKRRNGLNIDQEWILTCPGLVTGFTLGILAFTKEGDGVMIQTPVYPPFHSSVKNNNRILIENQLIEKEGYYTIDFEDFERKIRENNVKLFILCNPHNPVGRVWTLEELERMAEICLKYDVKIFSDEIHSDLILKGYKFKSILSLDEKYKKIIISAMAPSKTFNIAGLTASMVLIPDEDTRETYDKVRQSLSIGMLNIFGLTALEAAYRHGEQWLEEVMSYIEAHYAEPITIADLTRIAGASESTLTRQFHKVVGRSPIEHVLRVRVERAAGLIRRSDLRITEIAYECGFSDGNYLARQFVRIMGVSPSEYRRQNRTG